ncbi:MAG: flavodoxin family protein [Sphaerochaeta sp.]|jgi:NAD(P)H dehydrogenase (quinone)|nr:flavodoxin family protein [Sphaerochaeta sp.]MCH3920625.1 flavodoxin family protein [Sphaerochaeta sp.]MCI2046084.1 flavodoxin family protein [Sphaerochaeta sp.]MCI2076639.1 flavodoxin family protein [Sphaerochaeta sp.]MCI2105028.1 flavodoxin family protein [Sphaerochaeta sp.]
MKRCSIIIHSVTGNCYILGSYLRDLMRERNVDARLYRVEDPDLHIWAEKQDTTNEFYEDILALPVATIELLLKSDMIILGSPTRFGNVTAEMKAFLDETFPLSESRELNGKFFACFTSCPHSTNEGSHALDDMIHWAQCQGLLHIPFGVHAEIDDQNQPAAGIVHLAGKENMIRPSEQLGNVMSVYADDLAAYIQE